MESLHVRFVRYSLARSDDSTASLFQTGRRHPTVFHRRSFVLCYPGGNKGAWSIARASAKCKIKTTKNSSGGEMGFLQKFEPEKISRYMVIISPV